MSYGCYDTTLIAIGNGAQKWRGFPFFDFEAHLKHVAMVKNQYVRVEYNRLKHCTSNGMLDVAIGDPVWKWRIFELFWPKSGK